MNSHPDYYVELVRRRVVGDPALTATEQHELDLHLFICAQCNYVYAELLQPRAPEVAAVLRRDLESRLSADMVTPYLRDLAWAFYAGQPLSGFQRMVWQFVQRNQEALGRFRLLEAAVWLEDYR